MIKAILKGLLKMLMTLLNIFLIPVNALIENLFPSLSDFSSNFNNFLNIVGNNLAYFFSILPPIFKNLLVIWFGFVIAYINIWFGYKMILKIWNIIQKIKFW